MKLLRCTYQEKIGHGLLEGDQVRLVQGDWFTGWEKTATLLPLDQVKLLAPVVPPNIIAIGMNYRGHAQELGSPIPRAPVIFLKATTSLAGPSDPIILPTVAPNEVDYEAELVVVLGRTARNLKRSQVREFILGYSCGNDVSARDCQFRQDQQWARAKSFDSFAPLGPWLETELDPDHCRISSRLNGQLLQESNTADLIFDVAELVSYCSHQMTLLPGTVIMTGTPAGVGYRRQPPLFLKPGDQIEVAIEGIGVLKNRVENEGKG